jgi:alanine racemase
MVSIASHPPRKARNTKKTSVFARFLTHISTLNISLNRHKFNFFNVWFFAIIIYMRTRAIIHLDRFSGNFQAVQARIGLKKHICVPVKADAYGHGALKIAKTSLEAGAFCLGVATTEEGTELRKEIKAPILLMSQPHYREIPVIIKAELTPFVSDAGFIDNLNEQAKIEKIKLPIHIKIDTGMGRTGVPAEEALDLARHIKTCSNLELAGTATHFAVSDSADAGDRAYTKQQISRFNEAVDAIRAAGIDPGIIHAANSGAVILHQDAWFDMVRPGILLYGYKPVEDEINVQPVMELKTTVVMIKKIKKGESVSYGRTWTAAQDTYIAVLPAGYADGFPLPASGKWQAVIGGNVYPLAGRICMDQCCVDLGPESNVKRWDEAVIFGGPAQDAAILAKTVGTIPYEIICNINKRVPRVYEP